MSEHELMGIVMAAHAGITTDLDEAAAKGWTVVSMKDDWKTIFPDPKP